MKKIITLFITVALLALASVCLAAKPIVVFGAMGVETHHLMNKLEKPKFMKVANHNCAVGKIDGYPVVVMSTRMGMVNASSATTIAMEKFKPLYALSTGTAGAHRDQLRLNDIILCDRMCNSNVYVSEPRPRGAGSNGNDWSYEDSEICLNNQWDRIRYLRSDAKLMAIAKNTPYSKGLLVVGTSTSGDVWNRECDYIDYLHKEMGTICEDMESYGVASVCLKYGIPFLGVRVICNNELVEQTANSVRGGGMDWGEEDFYFNASTHCQNFAYDVIKKIIQEQRKK